MSIQNYLLKNYLRKKQQRVVERTKDNPTDHLRARKFFSKITAKLKMPKNVSLEKIKLYDIDAAWLTPSTWDKQTVLLYLHGGGYAVGSIETHKTLAAKIGLEANAKVLIIDYRLAPENKYPAAVEDAVQAYQWIIAQGFKANQIFIAGDSAGGGLTAATILHLRDHQLPAPAAAIMMSPWMDLMGTGSTLKTKESEDVVLVPQRISDWGKWYAGTLPLTHPGVSPLYAELHDLPPSLIQVGDTEILLDDAERFAAKATKAGSSIELKVWKKQFHVWQMSWSFLPEARKAIKQITSFIVKHKG